MTTLGKNIIPDDAKRDAIHVAVAPVTAGCAIEPGERVAVRDDEAYTTMFRPTTCGIADPFLRKTIRKGQRFYVLLDPDSVTDLRHSWTHPAFEDDRERVFVEYDECRGCG
jgi:hypothetical protein